MTLLPYTGANARSLCATENSQPVRFNNIVEQDHRGVKRVTRPMLGFKSFDAAQDPLVGIELMHMIRKRHPLEGSCQEAIPLPSTTFDIFSVAFRSAHSPPDWPSQTPPCCHARGVGSDAPHQSPSRLKAS